MPGDYNGLVDLAWERYHADPLFHARVHHAVAAVKQEAVDNGFGWPESFDGILKAVGALALLMPEIHDPDTGEYGERGENNEMAGDSGRTEGLVEQPVGPVQADQDQLDGLRPAEVDQRTPTS